MDKKKILIVDDEADILEVLTARFEANHYTVVTANDGETVMDKIRIEKPDAVLLDIMMPHVDGLTVLKNIRQENKTLPIFITTAFANEERRQIANTFNANGFMLKTQNLQDEINKITATIEIADKHKKA